MGFRLIKDFTLMLLIFSFINDNFIVDIAGESALKAIFGLFILVNIKEILHAFIRPKNRVLKTFFIFIFIMIIIMLISKIFYSHTTLGSGFLVLMPMTIIFAYLSYYENFERLLYIIWLSVVVSSIISFFNPPVDQWTFRRSGGTMDPNEFSTQLLMASAITIFLYEKNRNFIFLVGSLVLFLIVFVYAGSKSAMLSLVFLGLYALVIKFGSLFRKIFSFKGLIALAILGLIVLQVDFNKFEAVSGMQERAAQHGTADTRFVSWEAGWRMAQDNFLLGIGLEVYEDYARGYAVDYIHDGSLAPHNVFVKLIAEVGIFAFVGFLVFLYYLFTTKYMQIRQSSYFWISLVAYSNILMGLTLSSTYDKTFWISLGLLSNVIIILYKEQNEAKNENTPHFV